MNARADLAEMVMDHLGRSAGPATAALAGVIAGLASIMIAYDDAQERRGNWGGMLANLRRGVTNIEAALPLLRSHGGAGVAAVIELAERELAFAAILHDEIVRLQAGQSTDV